MTQIVYIAKDHDLAGDAVRRPTHWQLFYCLQGALTLTVDREIYAYSAREAVLVPPGTPYLHGGDAPNAIYRVTLDAPQGLPDRVATIRDNAPCDLGHLLDMCHRHCATISGDPRSDATLSAYSTLVLHTVRALIDESAYSAHVAELYERILQNFHDPDFDLDAEYAAFALSKDYIRRQFIAERGVSPARLLQRLRIEHAQKLLVSCANNRCKIRDVALRCGFRDPLYFSRVFRQTTGVSPKAYPHDDRRASAIPKSRA